MTIAAVLCCAMTTVVLTACTDANDNPANPAVPTSAVDNGTWQVTSEMMDLSYRPGDAPAVSKVCSLYLRLYSCPANRFISTTFLYLCVNIWH